MDKSFIGNTAKFHKNKLCILMIMEFTAQYSISRKSSTLKIGPFSNHELYLKYLFGREWYF